MINLGPGDMRMSHGTRVSPKYFKKGDVLVIGDNIAIITVASRGRDGEQGIDFTFVGPTLADGTGCNGLRLYNRRTK